MRHVGLPVAAITHNPSCVGGLNNAHTVRVNKKYRQDLSVGFNSKCVV